jgi:hypothetical protein
LNVNANGEIISGNISLRDETVFTRSTMMHRQRFDAMTGLVEQANARSRQSPPSIERRDDHFSRAEIFSQPFH